MSRQPRFEVVHNPGEPQPWWGRYRAANGRIVWTTETYTTRRRVLRAIKLASDSHALCQCRNALEVREVTE